MSMEASPNHAQGERGSHTGKGKDKRHVVSTTGYSVERKSRAAKLKIDMPPDVTGTGEQGS
jgi:hypothetical protein